jgi:Family of unknown function (DUF6134)
MIHRNSAAWGKSRGPTRLWTAIFTVLGGLAAAGPVAAAGPPTQFIYRVTHSVFGDIGTYINTVEPDGTGTLVLTQVNFDVRMLGVRVHHEVAQRTERWQGDRLVAFDGVTDKGHGPVEIKGVARGNRFEITSPQGTIEAPATVHPANPWSPNFLRTNVMMRVDTGRVESVRVSGGEPAVVTVGFHTVAARKYDIEGSTKYTVWLDGRGVPVKFVADDNSGEVTFTLDKCIHCGPDALRLGAN